MLAGARLLARALLAGLSLFIVGSPAFAQGKVPQFLVVDYNPVSKTAVPDSRLYDYVYRVDVRNSGARVFKLDGKVASKRRNVTVLDGNAAFGTVESRQVKASSDTITIRAHKHFDRRLDKKTTRNGKRVFEEDGHDPDDHHISGYPRAWGDLGNLALDNLFLMKSFHVLEWTFQVTADASAPTIGNPAPQGNVRTGQPTISAAYQDADSSIDTAKTVLTVDGNDVTAQAQVTTSGVTYTPPAALAEGAHSVALTAGDTAGNLANSAWSFTVDTIAPVVTGQSPINTDAASPGTAISAQFSDAGVGIDQSQVVLTVDGTDVTALATKLSDGVSYQPATRLAQGTHSATLKVVDLAGNVTEVSWTFGVDATGPALSTPQPDNVVLAADALPTISVAYADGGAGINLSQVVLLVDGQAVSGQASTTGVTYTPTQPLAEGVHTVKVTVPDANGNVSELSWSFTTRTLPTITQMAPKDVVVGAGTPVMIQAQYADVTSGIDATKTVLKIDNVDFTAQATITDSGVSLQPTTALPEGLHIVQLTVVDRVGNSHSETWRFWIDTGAPVISDQEPKNTITNVEMPTITAKYQDTGLDGSGIDVATVKLTVDGVDVTSSATVTEAQITYVPSAKLSSGLHTMVLVVADRGNNKTESVWSFIVDALRVVISGQGPKDVTLPADSIPTITANFADQGDAGVDLGSLKLEVDGIDVTSQAQVTTTAVNYIPTLALAEGNHAIKLSIADRVGNATISEWAFKTSTPPAIGPVHPSGHYITNIYATTLSAQYMDVGSGIDVGSIALYVDGVDVTAQSTITAQAASFVLPPTLLPGPHTARIALRDSAGNSSEVSWGFGVGRAPEITAMTPNNVVLPAGSRPQVSASFQAFDATVNLQRVEFSFDGVNVASQAQWTPSGVTYVPSEPIAPGSHVVGLQIVDSNGMTAATLWTFDVQVTPEYSVTVSAPPAGQISLDTEVEIVARLESNVTSPIRATIGGESAGIKARDGAALLFARSVSLTPGANQIPISAEFSDGTLRDSNFAIVYEPPPTVSISSPADLATLGPAGASSPRDLSGNVERPVTIVGRTSKPVQSVTINQQQAALDGQDFRFDNFFLHEGTNLLTAIATDTYGRTGAASVTVYVDQTAPTLNIEAPAADAVTSGAVIDVRGLVDDVVEGGSHAPNPSVLVTNSANDRTVSAEVADRWFVAPEVPLEVGANMLTVTAADQFGNARSKQITVSRVNVGSNRITILSGHRQRAGTNAWTPKPLVVLALDKDGNPIAGLPVTFDVVRGTGALGVQPESLPGVLLPRNLTRVTGPNGEASIYLQLGKQSGAGSNVVRASNPGIVEHVSFTATGDRGLPASVLIEGNGAQFAESGTTPLDPLSVVVYDQDRNAVPGSEVTFTVTKGDAAFSSGQSVYRTTTDKNGRAIARPQLGPLGGNVHVEVSAAFVSADGTRSPEIPGGQFEIVSLSQRDGPTQFAGHVLDHKGVGLAGVRLSIGRTTLSTTTDSEGRFTFDSDVPPGKIDLFIDGRTANPPSGLQYPALHFETTAVRGQRNILPHPIYLPPLLMSAAKVVGGPEDVTLTMPGFEGFAMVVKANSVTFPDGSRTGPIVVSPVHLDKLPMVPPGGASTFMAPAWTIQPSGTRFDPPIEVRIPNSLGLSRGETRDIFQWDHDLGLFVPMGKSTVTEDGALLVTEPNSGVTKAGWGGPPSNPPPWNCGAGRMDCTTCETGYLDYSGRCPKPACKVNQSMVGSDCKVGNAGTKCGTCKGGMCVVSPDSHTDTCCGGEEMNSQLSCCIQRSFGVWDQVDRGKKIAELLTEGKIAGLSVCKERYQASNSNYIETACPPPPKKGDSGISNERVPRMDGEMPSCHDGCSLPSWTVNGGKLVGIMSAPGASRDSILYRQDPTQGGPYQTSSTSFYEACNKHDDCYQTCGENRSTCDDALRDRSREKCAKAAGTYEINVPPDPSDPSQTSGAAITITIREACENNAGVYRVFLGWFGGFAFETRQEQYCDCCKPK